MRILIVSQYFPPEPFRVGDLAKALQERGNSVTVLTGLPNYPKGRFYDGYKVRPLQFEDYSGVRVIRVPLYPDTSYSKLRRTLNYASYAFFASLIGPFVVGEIDRIIVFQLSPVTIGLPGVLLKFFKRVPVLFWVQDIWPDSLVDSGMAQDGVIVRLIGSLVSFLYRHSDRVLVQSRAFISKVAERNVREEKIVYMPNWAEDLYQILPPDEQLRARENMAGRFNVVFAGNIGAAQGLEVLLDAAELLLAWKAIQFVVLGDGARLEELTESATKRGLSNLVFKGRKPLDTMPQYFALADVLLVMLKRSPLFAATIPSKIQSYLACGRPVLAALEGAGAQVVEEAQAGTVCQPENPKALAEGVLELYRMPREQLNEMAARGRQYYDANFARCLVIDKLQAVLSVTE